MSSSSAMGGDWIEKIDGFENSKGSMVAAASKIPHAGSAQRDPVAYRLELLSQHPRHAGVLKLAAAKAGWGTPLAAAPNGGKRGRRLPIGSAELVS